MLAIFAGVGCCAKSWAQRARFEDFFQVQNSPTPPPFPSRTIVNSPPPIQITPPPAVLQNPGSFSQGTPVTQGPNFAPTFNAPTVDPFQIQNQPFPVFPTQNAPQPIYPPINNQPGFGSGFQNPQPQFGTPQYDPNQFGLGQAPNAWPYEGTSSNWLPAIDWSKPQQAWQSFQQDFLPRVLERPRARQTYLFGDNGNELNINDIELATTATIQNFLQSNQPLRITPGFVFHFWDGPDSVVHPGFDLPAQAYSGFIALDHLTNPANPAGLETSFTVGYYSDFKNTSSEAFRFTGRLLRWRRLNSYTIGKFGIEYFDRVNVKMLPAFGVYLTPTPDIKFDLFFPKTKLAHRIPNISDFEAWVYVGGEYGGGSWAIERMGGMEDQVDINDVRSFVGVEWMGPRRVTGFFEAGYVFNREILYRSNPINQLDLQDTFMIRSGFAF